MLQLVLDTEGANLSLPESIKDGYHVEPVDLLETVYMSSGRMVNELRGWVWEISYQYGYFDDETARILRDICNKGVYQPIQCLFLPQNGTVLEKSSFFVVEKPKPKFEWSTADDEPVGIWADYALKLREVNPHDIY